MVLKTRPFWLQKKLTIKITFSGASTYWLTKTTLAEVEKSPNFARKWQNCYITIYIRRKAYLVSTAERQQYTPFSKSNDVNLLSCMVCLSEEMADLALWMIRSPVNQTPGKGSVNWQWSAKLISSFFYLHFNMPLITVLLDGCWGFLGLVESEISDPVRLLVSMTAIRCVFRLLASRGVKILLAKLAVGRITETKTKPDIPTQNAHFKVE